MSERGRYIEMVYDNIKSTMCVLYVFVRCDKSSSNLCDKSKHYIITVSREYLDIFYYPNGEQGAS